MAIKSRRAARIGLELDAGRLNPGISEARKKLRAFAADTKRTLGGRALGALGKIGNRRIGSGFGMAKSAGKGLLLGAGLGAVGGIASVISDVVDFEKALTRFQIAGERTPAQMAAFREQLNKVAASTGVARAELLSGASAYVALTGDANGAVKATELFAKVSNATGASMADIAGTAAALKDNLKIDPAEFEAAFSALHVQGKAGAVELRELATELAGVAPSFAQFAKGTGAGGLAKLGASLQVVRKGFGSTSEAATGLQSLMVSISKNAGRFEKAGIKVFTKDPKTGKKHLRDFVSIIDAISRSKLAKDPTLLGKAFGRDEARRAYDQLALNRGLLDDLITKSSDKSAIERDAATFQQSTAGKLAIALETLKTSIANAFTPERIQAFVGAVGGLVDMVGKLAGALGKVAEVLDFIRGGHAPATAAEKRMGGNARVDPHVMFRDQKEINELRALGQNAPLPEMRAQALAEAARRQAAHDAIEQADFAEFQRRQRAQLSTELAKSPSVSSAKGIEEMSLGELMKERSMRSDPTHMAAVAEVERLRKSLNVTVKVDSDVVAKAHGKAKQHRAGPVGR